MTHSRRDLQLHLLPATTNHENAPGHMSALRSFLHQRRLVSINIHRTYIFHPSRHMSGATRVYKDAIERLNSLQSNAATLEAVHASGGRLSDFAIPEMIEYLERIGYTVSEL